MSLLNLGFPGGSEVKNLPPDAGSIPGSGRTLEKEMETHSSILARRILRTEEPGRSMGSQKVGHDLATKQHIEFVTIVFLGFFFFNVLLALSHV